jgi:hypothetical protein
MCTLLHLVHPILCEKKNEREVNGTLLASSCSTDNERVSFEKYTPRRICKRRNRPESSIRQSNSEAPTNWWLAREAQLMQFKYGPALTHPVSRPAHFASNPTATGNEMAPCYTNTSHTTGNVRSQNSSFVRHQLAIERYPIFSHKNIRATPTSPSHSGQQAAASRHGDTCGGSRRGGLLVLLLPRRATEGRRRRGEGAEPRARRGGRDVLQGVLLRRGQRRRPRGGGRVGSRAAQEGGLRGRRRARVQVPLRARRAGARRHRRRRRARVRAQAAPRDRPQHRQDRQELPAGEGWGMNPNGVVSRSSRLLGGRC